MLMDSVSIIYDATLNYFDISPFNPSVDYPEYPWGQLSAQPNPAYEAVRNSLIHLGLDQENINTPHWNPFKDFIKPGDTVLVKPNFVLHFHPIGEDIKCIVTHPSVIRAAVDYVAIALQNNGKIIIGDAPIQSCRIEELLNANGLYGIIDFIRKNTDIDVEFRDLREEIIRLEKHSIISARRKNKVNVTVVDLGTDSKLEEIIQDAHMFAVDGYVQRKTVRSHTSGKHIYDINALTYEVDAIVNIPKLKTHKKAGITAAIKNFVGLNANKDRLPHFRVGSPTSGGDEYPSTNIFRELYRYIIQLMTRTDNKPARYIMVSLLFLLRKIFALRKFRLVQGGAWPGNDTLWRMVFDLTKIIYYGDANREIHNTIKRKVFHIVDGIIAGEKFGPLSPSPKQSGLIIAGFNPFLTDAVACELMGFDYQKIKTVSQMQELFLIQPEEATVILNGDRIDFNRLRQRIHLAFIPSFGWDEIIKK